MYNVYIGDSAQVLTGENRFWWDFARHWNRGTGSKEGGDFLMTLLHIMVDLQFGCITKLCLNNSKNEL
jgi:hypothetical protein